MTTKDFQPTKTMTEDTDIQSPTDSPTGLPASAGSALYLDVQVYGGTDIRLACRDACALANKLGITVWFGFNGKRLHANPDTDWQRLVAGWYKAGADKQEWVRPV